MKMPEEREKGIEELREAIMTENSLKLIRH